VEMPVYWQQCERCLPHALVCAELVKQKQINSREAGYLFHKTASYLHVRGRYENSVEELYRFALVTWEQTKTPIGYDWFNNFYRIMLDFDSTKKGRF
jgi:hypothetical protein